MVEVHLYGNLRHYAGDIRPGQDMVLQVQPGPGETIASLLERAGIRSDEIGHIFFNARLLATRTTMAPFYGYLQERDTVFEWDLQVPVGQGDRIGLFGTDLPILSM
jgi:hypothetical protein